MWDPARDEPLKPPLHRRPRAFGEPTGLWTPALAAEVCQDTGWTPRARTNTRVTDHEQHAPPAGNRPVEPGVPLLVEEDLLVGDVRRDVLLSPGPGT